MESHAPHGRKALSCFMALAMCAALTPTYAFGDDLTPAGEPGGAEEPTTGGGLM